MPKKRNAPSRGQADEPRREEPSRGKGTEAGAAEAAAEGLLLEMVDFERATIAFVEEARICRERGIDFRAGARRSQREVLLCLRELEATDPASLSPAAAERLREWRRTWKAMRCVGRRTLRRLDDLLARK